MLVIFRFSRIACIAFSNAVAAFVFVNMYFSSFSILSSVTLKNRAEISFGLNG